MQGDRQDLLDHVVGVGRGAAGDEPAERAVDQRRKVRPEVLKQGQTLNTALRGTRVTCCLTETERQRERDGERHPRVHRSLQRLQD